MPRGYSIHSTTFNVAPRYTAGSPAAVDPAIALKVAREEREAFEVAKDGIYGDEDKNKAERLGLDMIVFEMVEVAGAWLVADIITKKQYRWPFVGRCPSCKRRFNARRGIIDAHMAGNPAYNPCAAQTFIGSILRDEDMFRPHLELEAK